MMKIIDSDNYQMPASPGVNLLMCHLGCRGRATWRCAEGRLHGRLSFIFQGLSRLGIYISHYPAVISTLLANSFIREQEKDHQRHTPSPPRRPWSSNEFLQAAIAFK